MLPKSTESQNKQGPMSQEEQNRQMELQRKLQEVQEEIKRYEQQMSASRYARGAFWFFCTPANYHVFPFSG
jgi:hypothetical protein